MSGKSSDMTPGEYWQLLCRIAGYTVLTVQFLVRHWLLVIAVASALTGAWWLWTLWGALFGVVPVSTFWYARIALALNSGEASSWKAVLRGWWKERAVRARWQHVMYQHKLHARGDVEHVPQLVNAKPTDSGFTAQVATGSIALDAHTLTKHEKNFAAGFMVDRVSIRPMSPWMANIRFDWGQHLRRTFTLHDLPVLAQDSDKPARVVFGVDEAGKPASIVSNISTLVGGVAGAGKSSTIWALCSGYVQTVPVRFRFVDPSGIEFAAAKRHLGKGLVHDYVSDPHLPGSRSYDDFWEALTRDFNRRMQRVEESGERWHRPTKAEPLDVLVIDEILPLAGELKKESTDHIVGRIIFLGRKAGFVVIGASQAGQVDAIGRIRDLFPQRICHRTESFHMTDAFLGPGAEKDGAHCSTLDTVHDQGVLYSKSEGEPGYRAARAAYVSNDETDQIAQGLMPVQKTEHDLNEKPTSLYAFYNEHADLLYVGIAESERLENRWKEHARSKTWWPEVVHQKELHRYPDRHMALTAEESMIQKNHPKYNKQHNTNRRNREYA